MNRETAPLRTLSLFGICRSSLTRSDREWFFGVMSSAAKDFAVLDLEDRGILVAFRRGKAVPGDPETSPGPATPRRVIIAGRMEAAGVSLATLAQRLDSDRQGALSSLAGPVILFSSTPGAEGAILYRPLSGQRAISYATLPDGVIFASDVATLTTHPEVDTGVDWSSVAEQFALGQVLGDKCLVRAVRRLEAGCLLKIPREGRPSLESLLVLPTEGGQDSNALERVDEALHEAVAHAWSPSVPTALCLSAGLDSRTLLAVAHNMDIPLRCVTNGIEGSVELKLTRRMCQSVGAEHIPCLIDSGVVDDILDGVSDVVAYTDGEGTIQSANMLHITRKYRRELGLERVIRGIGGELMKLSLAYGYALPPELIQQGSDDAVLSCLLRQLIYPIQPDEQMMFKGELRELLPGHPVASFTREWNALEQLGPSVGARAGILFLRSYVARATVHSMSVLRQSVDLAQPFLNERFLQALFSAPIETRLDRSLQIQLIRRNAPALLKIPDSDIRSPLDASPLRRWTATQAERVARRLGRRKLDVPESWLVERLDGFFREVLSDERALSRSHVDADGIRRLLGASPGERAQRRLLLGRAAAFEIYLRTIEP